MAKKRYITNPFLNQLGIIKPSSKVMVINPNGEVVNSGKTIDELSAGVPLESDNVNDASPNINKFVTENDIDKLNNIVVTAPVDLDLMQQYLVDINNEDLAQYFLNQITF